MPLGIVVERRPSAHRWQAESWRPTALLPGAPPAEWLELPADEEAARWHAVTLPLELHARDTELYKLALSMLPPVVHVVLRQGEAPWPWRPFLVTASPMEAAAHGEFGDDRVEPLPMPDGLIAWVQDFVDRRHVEQPIFRRKRKGRDKGLGEGSDFEEVRRG